MIIAIDGPAGAGKSTVAKILAKRLGFLYIDTGAMYRALTLKALNKNLDFKDEAKIIETAKNSVIELRQEAGTDNLIVLLDGEDVTLEIRHPRVTEFVSIVAKIPQVREVMVQLQRRLGLNKDAVLEGRDIGTVVFPEAQIKFYLDASKEERALRRYKELKDKGQEISLEDTAANIAYRDATDSTRHCAPLRKAADALYIDTTHMSIQEVVETLYAQVIKHGYSTHS